MAESTENAHPTTPASHIPYLIAIVVMVLIAVGSIITVMVLRPTQDNSSIYALILGSIGPTTLALLALMKAQETHLSVNSRLDRWIKSESRVARDEGEKIGRAAGIASANERTDALKDASALRHEEKK